MCQANVLQRLDGMRLRFSTKQAVKPKTDFPHQGPFEQLVPRMLEEQADIRGDGPG